MAADPEPPKPDQPAPVRPQPAENKAPAKGNIGAYAGEWVLAKMETSQAVAVMYLEHKLSTSNPGEEIRAYLPQMIADHKKTIERLYDTGVLQARRLNIRADGNYNLTVQIGREALEKTGTMKWNAKEATLELTSFEPEALHPFEDVLLQPVTGFWCLVRVK